MKTEIRAALLRDQLWVCAYCMGRIVPDERAHPTRPDGRPVPAMKVEHWQPRSRYPALGLSWTNLLGVCLGGIGKAPSEQTCDARKADAEIALNPRDAAHVATLHCTSNGRLTSTDPRFQIDLEDRLGLNHRVLVEGRRALLDRELSRLGAAHPRGQPLPGRVARGGGSVGDGARRAALRVRRRASAVGAEGAQATRGDLVIGARTDHPAIGSR